MGRSVEQLLLNSQTCFQGNVTGHVGSTLREYFPWQRIDTCSRIAKNRSLWRMAMIKIRHWPWGTNEVIGVPELELLVAITMG